MGSPELRNDATARGYPAPAPAAPPGAHIVHFYAADDALVRVVAPFVLEGLEAGESVVAIATNAHLDAFERAVQARYDLDRARREGRFVALAAEEALSRFMVADQPDPLLFEAVFGELLDRAEAASPCGRVRACGQMVDVLWERGNGAAVLALEECWERLLEKRPLSLFCAYRLDAFAAHEHAAAFAGICARHSLVAPSLDHALVPPGELPGAVAQLEQRARALETEVGRSRRLQIELRAKVAQLDRAARESEVLFRVTDAAIRAGTQEDIYQAALDAIGRGLGVERASVLLFDGDGVMRFKAFRGLSDGYRAAVEGHSPWKPDEKNPSPVLVEDVTRDPALAGLMPVLEAEGIAALAFFPLFANGLLLGKFMLYYAEPHRFGEPEKRLAQAIAHQVAFAVDRQLAQQERDRILGIVSHDLRNPLGAVTMAAGALLRQNLDAPATRFVRRIVNGAARMERLIAQLLEFAQARHGGGIPVRRRPADLAEVLARVVDEIETAYPQSMIRVAPCRESTGAWDPDRIAEVLSNLIGNAVQHGGGSPVSVLLEDTADEARIQIHNGGPGIPAGLMPKLFDPYRRGVEPVGRLGNVGLGLFISREIVRAHGGSIEVRSTDSEGTTFTVRLPRA